MTDESIEKIPEIFIIKDVKIREIITYNHNNTMNQVNSYGELPKTIRCQSVYCDYFGYKSKKYHKSHDIQMEFPNHSKQRLVQEKKNNQKLLTISNSTRTLQIRSPISPRVNYGTCIKKPKDHRGSQQIILPEVQSNNFQHKIQQNYSKPLEQKSPSIQIDHQLTNFSNFSPLSSRQNNISGKSLQIKNSQFSNFQIQFNKANALKKLLMQSKYSTNIASPKQNQTQKSNTISLHHNNLNQGTNNKTLSFNSAYVSQNNFLRKIIKRYK